MQDDTKEFPVHEDAPPAPPAPPWFFVNFAHGADETGLIVHAEDAECAACEFAKRSGIVKRDGDQFDCARCERPDASRFVRTIHGRKLPPTYTRAELLKFDYGAGELNEAGIID